MTTRRKQRYLRWHPRGAFAHTEHEQPAHDPPLSAHDEAVFLLHIAAEVEHALLVQYLYAACSLKRPEDVPEEHRPNVKSWRRTLLGIAREEMGHLITVQNLLRLIGGPVILEREDYPFQSGLYPFHFRLQPLSRDTLSRYVLAEMPHLDAPTAEIREIMQRASGGNDPPVNRVGTLYIRIAHLFSHGAPDEHLQDGDFSSEAASRQAHWDEWGNGGAVLVPPVSTREEAQAAIYELSEQGEGVFDSTAAPSHFQRFLSIYREFPEPGGDWQPAYDVPVDPNMAPHGSPETEGGRITHPYSSLWAHLANMRYRLLLNYLSHFLYTDGPLLDEEGDYTARGFLQKWTFDEMRRLGALAGKLATLPRREGDTGPGAPRAGAPFELPYTLSLPDQEAARWRAHGDVLSTCVELVERIKKVGEHAGATGSGDTASRFLDDLLAADKQAIEVARAAALGAPLPPHDDNFRKVTRILESAVRGFRIGAHHNFWRGCTRDQFVEMGIFGNPLIARTPDGGFDAANSNLLRALRGEDPFTAPEESEGPPDYSHYPRMPAHHPPVPPQCIEFISRWIESGCPDSDPPGRVGTDGEAWPL